MELHFDVARQVRDTAKTDHAVHGVEPGSQACKGKNRGVFDYGSAVDHGMLFDYCAPRN
jgi:hypothetical protein